MGRFKNMEIGVKDKIGNELKEGGVIVIREAGFDEEYGYIEYSDKTAEFFAVFKDGEKIEKVPISEIAGMVVQTASIYDVPQH